VPSILKFGFVLLESAEEGSSKQLWCLDAENFI